MQRFACAGAAFLLNPLSRNRSGFFKGRLTIHFKGQTARRFPPATQAVAGLFTPVAAELRWMHLRSPFERRFTTFIDTLKNALQGTVIAVSLEEDTTASTTGLSLPAIRAHARKSYLDFLNRIGPKSVPGSDVLHNPQPQNGPVQKPLLCAEASDALSSPGKPVSATDFARMLMIAVSSVLSYIAASEIFPPILPGPARLDFRCAIGNFDTTGKPVCWQGD
jgi:hypothetical protein